jgi:ribonuclease D
MLQKDNDDKRVGTNDIRKRPSCEEINALPLCHYGGEVRFIRSLVDLKDAKQDLASEPILGFDTETRPTFYKGKANPPSLIQLATAEVVYLIQLNFLPFSQPLAAILENSNQIKVGVAIRDDMRELATLYAFEPKGLVDLGALARSHKLSAQGLRTLAANLFGRRISKGPRCSNWSLAELSPRQIVYAATDAWMGRLLYLRMRELGLTPGEPSTDGSCSLDILNNQESRVVPDY